VIARQPDSALDEAGAAFFTLVGLIDAFARIEIEVVRTATVPVATTVAMEARLARLEERVTRSAATVRHPRSCAHDERVVARLAVAYAGHDITYRRRESQVAAQSRRGPPATLGSESARIARERDRSAVATPARHARLALLTHGVEAAH
jgi:hypothetical protein